MTSCATSPASRPASACAWSSTTSPTAVRSHQPDQAPRPPNRLAPTVVFLAPDGTELAERLIGYPSADFYGAYLEQRLEQARARLGAR